MFGHASSARVVPIILVREVERSNIAMDLLDRWTQIILQTCCTV